MKKRCSLITIIFFSTIWSCVNLRWYMQKRTSLSKKKNIYFTLPMNPWITILTCFFMYPAVHIGTRMLTTRAGREFGLSSLVLDRTKHRKYHIHTSKSFGSLNDFFYIYIKRYPNCPHTFFFCLFSSRKPTYTF